MSDVLIEKTYTDAERGTVHYSLIDVGAATDDEHFWMLTERTNLIKSESAGLGLVQLQGGQVVGNVVELFRAPAEFGAGDLTDHIIVGVSWNGPQMQPLARAADLKIDPNGRLVLCGDDA